MFQILGSIYASQTPVLIDDDTLLGYVNLRLTSGESLSAASELIIPWDVADVQSGALWDIGTPTEVVMPENAKYAVVSSNVSAYGGEPTPASIRAVVIRAVAQRGTSGVSQLTQFLRIGGTNYDGSAVAFATGEQKIMQEVYDNNPATAGAWAVADLASIEMGLLAET